ncbi:MAG: glycosyltransferase [Verrucomicrobia bacterium]|nr:glycosyltransferase [Verrucomicrobiota bacterium]MBU1735463.1 glycosyltransferase [Verrucomicrobiota bacterium]MBU1856858.1 glycosyltransferase [Verrucomicrobiota bacterium]
MAEVGLDVTVMGFPLDFDPIKTQERLRYISVQSGLSARCRELIAFCSRRLGRSWLFVVEVGWTQWAALRYARRHGADVLYISDIEPWLFLPVMWLNRFWRRGPRVVGFYAQPFDCISTTSSLLQMPWYTCLRTRLNYWAALRLPKIIDVVSDCKYTVTPYTKVSPDRVHAIMEGYERPHLNGFEKCRARRELSLPSDKKILLRFGLGSPGKGTDFLLAALKGIPTAFELYVVGQMGIICPDEDLASLVPGAWREHVHFVSRYVSEKERIAYFSACDGIVLPYRFGFSGASGNFRDAISFGKAVLASDQFLMGEMVRKYDLGLLFKPEDVEDLRRALVEFTQKTDDWFQGIAERSKAIVEEFAWDKIGMQYRELFERLVADGKR